MHIMLDLETWGTEPGCDIRSIGACVFAPHTRRSDSLVHDGSLGTIKPFYITCDNPETHVVERNGVRASVDDLRLCEFPGAHFDGVDSLRRYPLHRLPKTVQWWSEQSDEAQVAFAPESCGICNGRGEVPDYGDLSENSGEVPDYGDLSENSGFVRCHTCDGRGKVMPDLREALMRFGLWLRNLTGDIYTLNHPEHRVPDDMRIWSHGPQFDVSILAAAYKAVDLPVPWHYRAPRDTRTCFDLAGISDHSEWLKQHPGPLGIPHHALDDAICQARAVCAAYGRLRVPHDVVTHRPAWRSAIADWSHHTRDENGSGFWSHELDVFDNTFDDLAAHPHTEK